MDVPSVAQLPLHLLEQIMRKLSLPSYCQLKKTNRRMLKFTNRMEGRDVGEVGQAVMENGTLVLRKGGQDVTQVMMSFMIKLRIKRMICNESLPGTAGLNIATDAAITFFAKRDVEIETLNGAVCTGDGLSNFIERFNVKATSEVHVSDANGRLEEILVGRMEYLGIFINGLHPNSFLPRCRMLFCFVNFKNQAASKETVRQIVQEVVNCERRLMQWYMLTDFDGIPEDLFGGIHKLLPRHDYQLNPIVPAYHERIHNNDQTLYIVFTKDDIRGVEWYWINITGRSITITSEKFLMGCRGRNVRSPLSPFRLRRP